jgi:hypothetical protein
MFYIILNVTLFFYQLLNTFFTFSNIYTIIEVIEEYISLSHN